MADGGLATVPGVELLRTGTWQASTGEFTVTPELIAATAAAHRGGTVPAPVIRLGHVTPDAPAYGRVTNIRASADGRTLYGDLTGIPPKLAKIMHAAFPHRSIEGEHDYIDRDGTTHRFALTGLALLGAEAPAVHGLAEIADLYDVAASNGRRVVRLAAPTPHRLNPHQRALTLAAARRRRRNQQPSEAP